MTEPASTQHPHSRAARQLSAKNPGVYGEAGREQGSRRGRIKLRQKPKSEPAIDDDIVGQAAIAVDSDDLLFDAELLHSLPAKGTFETGRLLVTDTDTITPAQVGDL